MMFFSHFSALIVVLSLLSVCCSALPEPATVFQQQHPHQVGFVIPPAQSPPYGKALPASSYSSHSRTWEWTQWLTDAKSAFKAFLSNSNKSRHRPSADSDDRKGRRLSFDDDIVLRVNISSLADRLAISELAESMILDIWSMTPSHVDIRIPKTATRGFLAMLPDHISHHEQLITNLRAAVDYTYPAEQTVLPSLEELLSIANTDSARRRAEDIHYLNEIFFANYQSYETIKQWLYLLESLRPELVEVINLGNSYEGREILGIKLKGSKSPKHKDQHVFDDTTAFATQGIIMHAAQHAREWISVSTVCYIAYEMIAGYYVNEKTRKLVDEFEWSFFPILNVDGYEYSWTTDRLWRKNRQPTPVPFCTGVDPDRSWGYKWDAPGAEILSSNPCSESYRGEKPFEARESKLMANYITTTLKNRNVEPIAYVDFHSYSQSILYPFAYDCSVLPRDAEDLAEAAWGAAKAARNVHGHYFDVNSACDGDNFLTTKEPSSKRVINGGAAVDWAYALGKIPFAYTIKLRDTGNHGFLLPRSEIIPSGEEMFAMALHLGEFILEKP